MSFSIKPTHNFLMDTPVIAEEKSDNDNTVAVETKNANNTTTSSTDDSNILSKGNNKASGGLQVQQVPGALDDFY
jgi:hypothetical protein